MLDLHTERLDFELVGEQTDPDEVLPVFNTNRDWIAASDHFAGSKSWNRSDVEMHLWQESLRENSVSFGIRWAETGDLVALGTLLEPHPGREVPMIGLLLVHGDWQRRGIGGEAATGLEGWLTDRGWDRVLVTVLEECPRVRIFWERRGFRVRELKKDQDKRSVWVLGKGLP